MAREVVVLSGVRTAIGSFGGSLKDIAPSELAAKCVKEAVRRSGVKPAEVGHVVFGNVIHTDAHDHYLARIAGENDLTVFEYFLTDAAGHKGKPAFTAHILDEVDQLLRGVLDEINLHESLVITTSDHGNLEDTSAKAHTLNPVPTMLLGAGREKIAPRIHSLDDITPAIVDLLLGK